MADIKIQTPSTELSHILCLGAHCDDAEIGCGGALLSILEQNPNNIHVTWVIFTSSESRKKEAIKGAELFTANARSVDIKIFDYRDGFLPYTNGQIKDTFEEVKAGVDTPDLIFTHYRHDRHQDHRLVSELTWNTYRNHPILEYEIPKWDGDMGQPNTFIPLTREQGLQKIRLLQEVYNTQQTKNWFTDDLFWSLMRLRGMECNAPSTIAEGFYSRKLTLDFSPV